MHICVSHCACEGRRTISGSLFSLSYGLQGLRFDDKHLKLLSHMASPTFNTCFYFLFNLIYLLYQCMLAVVHMWSSGTESWFSTRAASALCS